MPASPTSGLYAFTAATSCCRDLVRWLLNDIEKNLEAGSQCVNSIVWPSGNFLSEQVHVGVHKFGTGPILAAVVVQRTVHPFNDLLNRPWA